MNKKNLCFHIAISFSIFVAMTIFVKTGIALNFDLNTAVFIQSFESDMTTAFFKAITFMGDWYIYVPIMVLLLAFPKTRLKAGIPTASALILSVLANQVLKRLFAVPRPVIHRLAEADGFSFPSGHTMNGTAFILCIVFFISPLIKNKVLRLITATGAVLFVILLEVSRIYLGVHYPTDIIAGFAGGGVFVFSVLFFREYISKSS